jgi:hypothetical protein
MGIIYTILLQVGATAGQVSKVEKIAGESFSLLKQNDAVVGILWLVIVGLLVGLLRLWYVNQKLVKDRISELDQQKDEIIKVQKEHNSKLSEVHNMYKKQLEEKNEEAQKREKQHQEKVEDLYKKLAEK